MNIEHWQEVLWATKKYKGGVERERVLLWGQEQFSLWKVRRCSGAPSEQSPEEGGSPTGIRGGASRQGEQRPQVGAGLGDRGRQARAAEQSEQERQEIPREGREGRPPGLCRTSGLILSSSATRGNDAGRRNKGGLCLPT